MLVFQTLLTLAIIGGTPAADCDYPSTVQVSGCSGVLVHPRIVLTAAHCFPNPMENVAVNFGSSALKPMERYTATYCLASSHFATFGDGYDWAYCLLDEPVTNMPVTPVVTEPELVALDKVGLNFDVKLVGFGRDENNIGWYKRAITMHSIRVSLGEIDLQTQGVAGGCYGDSGGPAYVRLPRGGWRVLATDSYGNFCGGTETVTLVHQAVRWVEAETGFDITSATEEPTNLLTLPSDSGGCQPFTTQSVLDASKGYPGEHWYIPGTRPPEAGWSEVALDDGCSTTGRTWGIFECLLIVGLLNYWRRRNDGT